MLRYTVSKTLKNYNILYDKLQFFVLNLAVCIVTMEL